VEESGAPTLLYPMLARRLAEALDVSPENLREGEELNEVACRYITGGKGGVEDIYPALKAVMSRIEASLKTPEALVKVAGIQPLRLFVTTTFDPLMARALEQVRGSSPPVSVYAHSPSELQDLPKEVNSPGEGPGTGSPIVYHLMGRISATPSYAVTQEDIVEFFHSLQSETRRPQRLFEELNHQSLLILGCRFGGWLTRFLMRMSKGQRLSAGRRSDYVADQSVSGDESLVLFLRHFSRATRVYRSGGVLEFVDELHGRWIDAHPVTPAGVTDLPARGRSPSPAEPGAVFISYASEDRQAAEALKSALEAAGVDVFFDRDDLQAGTDWEARLRRFIRQCSLFVPVISGHTRTLGRRFFRVEWNLAVEEAQMASFSDEEAFLLPVVIDATQPADADVPEKFRAIQWESLPGGRATPEFVSRVQQLYRRYQKDRAITA